MEMKDNNEIDRLCSRHIAKCIERLGDNMSGAEKASIKRSFRFYTEDVKQVINQVKEVGINGIHTVEKE